MRINRVYYACSLICCLISVFQSFGWCETPAWIEAFADKIYAAWKAGEPMPQISIAYPEAVQQEAYLVQRAFVEHIMKSILSADTRLPGLAAQQRIIHS